MRRNLRIVLLFAIMATAAAVILLLTLGAWQWVGSPGPMSAGHADLACKDCHVDFDTSDPKMNSVCLDCHQEEVGAARNAHSPAYFDIVGRRETPWYVATSACLDCHRGHQRKTDPNVTAFIPGGYCVACHSDVQERVRGREFVTSHESFGFASCQGCHQFHERTLFPPHPRQTGSDH